MCSVVATRRRAKATPQYNIRRESTIREFPSTRRIGSTVKLINLLIRTASLIKLFTRTFYGSERERIYSINKVCERFSFIKKIFYACIYKTVLLTLCHVLNAYKLQDINEVF